MNWVNTPIEKLLIERITKCETLSGISSEELIRDYENARDGALSNFLEDIKRTEHKLTDHSRYHIEDVLERAYLLICHKDKELNEIELYVLCLCIWFHDVGNIDGRQGHYDISKIQEKYEYIRDTSKNPRFKDEKLLVSRIASSHSGKSKKNKREPDDTISDLNDGTYFGLYGKEIAFSHIAAILRFADELAEGPQRTSQYLLDSGFFKDDIVALEHHLYSRCARYSIDRNKGRISINYFLSIDKNANIDDEINLLHGRFAFCFERLNKLNRERVYCRRYSSLLAYNEISAQFYFSYDGVEEQLKNDPFIITDRANSIFPIEDLYPEYEMSSLLTTVREFVIKRKENK